MFDGNIASNKKARKSTPKVRSGSTGLRASRKCEGYPEGARGLSAQPLPLEPASITAYSIPFKVPGSQADRQLLHYFCCQAAWNLSSGTDPTLWTELILQRANHQPVIRNALVALSSLHKDYLCGELAGPEYETPTPSTSLAPVANVKTMAVISRCHRQLRNYLARPDASPDVALVCSLIFYTFESLLGESQRAIWHLDQGLILLRKCQLDHSLASDDPLIPHLSTLLHHLDLQASCFDDRRPPLLRLATDAETKGHVDIVPDTFLDLTHAEAVLTKIQNWALHHLVNYVHYRGAGVEELPSESFVERLVLAAQLQKFETVLDRFAYHGSSISNTATHNQREDRRQQRTQRLLLLRVNLHTFSYLVKENLPLLTADAYDMAKKVMALLPGFSERPLAQMVLSGGETETDLESALASIEALLSQTWPLPDSAATGAGTTTTSATPARPYTLSTHLIAAIYFLSLKTTNKQIVEKATALFSHPQLRHARDGLWDARTAAFLVKNLVRVRQNGNVTEGRDASDILMHIAEQDIGVDIAQLQRIFHMSEKAGLPMMQSKKFTLVLRKGAVVRKHIGQEHTVSSCAYSSTPTSATVKRDAHDVHAPVHGFEHQQHVAGARRHTLPTDHLAPMPVPPRRTPSKTGPSRAQGKFGPQTQPEGTANVSPEYPDWNAGIHVSSDPSAVFKPEPYPTPAAVTTRPFRF
ncbi:Zn(II)2Cys6 transcription factor [Cladophialophora carrionii]|uniref:Zn(II)2Cys6 transcription factor n=1 Tax=Cladophialophora carrionii TaxID=86049 RepID=A0A1C1CGK8_9EURO|nr:Zn(II)2Cys6 transcription factor [Cladophialophora carrionii]